MTILISILIPIAAAFFGAWVGRKYDAFISNRQEKAILALFVQEFSLLLRRSKMYYRQMLGGGISFSTLFEASDASTFVKLAEVGKNSGVIDRILELKADFFQVIRFANKASEAAAQARALQATGGNQQAQQKWIEAKVAQGMAIVFFMGDLEVEGVFHRKYYKEYIENLQHVIDYLQTLNPSSSLILYLLDFMPRMKREKESLDNFISQHKEELSLIKEILELLREKERLLVLENKA